LSIDSPDIDVRALRRRLDAVLCRDLPRLRARLRRARTPQALAELAGAIAASEEARARRIARLPRPTFDAALPISREAERIIELIGAHQVVVVAGETGSGKTTQLPKLALAAGRGAGGLIGCTQPRRIAARSAARRVAEELGTPLGGQVGYQVRFAGTVGDDTLVKFMTDGILLAETQGDRGLHAYDTLIIDEVHERSLNIDFLLGYLKQLLPRRPELRLVITSATLDTQRFSDFFGGAPVVAVEGRGHPVELRWRPQEPAEGRGGRGLLDGIAAVCDEITGADPLGDVLVFLSGEREIRDAHHWLERRRYRETEVLPLYARLSSRDQDRVFHPGPKRRIVLATNVAETSLTVPRIRYVVDPGTARVSRYSARQQVQRLQVEPISQAAAAQRAGRCGRIGPGVCYRLYDEQDFAGRPAFTDPELLRASLAGVILRMLALGLGEVETFPFLDPPQPRAVSDGFQQLLELGAIDGERRLTAIGRTLAKLPIDVQLGRMLVEGERLGSLAEVGVIAAFLSIQDPRERPADRRALADAAHAAFADPASDFVGIVNLWRAFCEAHESLGQAQLRDWCAERFLSFPRMREWRELHRQLLIAGRELGWRENAEPASYEAIHRAMLSGLPLMVGRRDAHGEFEGPRGRRFRPFPASSLARKPPAWVLSAQLLDLERVWALLNARVEPHWIEQQAAHLLKRTHFEPWFDARSGRVLVHEQVSLFGLVLAGRRRVDYGTVDPADARRIFIREALATASLDATCGFLEHNRAVLAEAREHEARLRRQGLVREPEALADFFESRLPSEVRDRNSLERWWRRAAAAERQALRWRLEDVLVGDDDALARFPDHLDIEGQRYRLGYRFHPGADDDGVSLHVPLLRLNALPSGPMEWLVPGLLEDKVAALIRGLPKALRRNFVPAPDFARAFVESAPERESGLTTALAAFLHRITGVEVPADAWDEAALPAHLRMRIVLADADGREIAAGRDLPALRAGFGARARAEFAKRTASTLARRGITDFDFEALPDTIETDSGLAAFPALVDDGDSVAIEVFEQRAAAEATHSGGLRRLLRLQLADARRQAVRQLPLDARLALRYVAFGGERELRDAVVDGALDALLETVDAGIRDRERFEAARRDIARGLFAAAVERLEVCEAILAAYAELLPALQPPMLGFAAASFDDLRAQLDGLLVPGFPRIHTLERLRQFPRYLRAVQLRAQRLIRDPARDQARMLGIQPFQHALTGMPSGPARERLRWLLEEYRVSLFAQELGTAEPVSEKRLARLLAEAGAG
jgi:ATP-dependent helicase HrpA